MTEIAKHSQEVNAAKLQRFFVRPADRCLTAYKAWICGTYEALIAQADLPSEEDNMTEEEWVTSWRNFWNGVERNWTGVG